VRQQEAEIWQDLDQVLFVPDLPRDRNNELMVHLVRKIAILHLHIAAKVAKDKDQVEQLARQQDQALENQVAVLHQEDQGNAEALAEHLEKMLERKRITNQRRLVAKR
jgi:GTPase Era involved in 16S rRNA processing